MTTMNSYGDAGYDDSASARVVNDDATAAKDAATIVNGASIAITIA